MAELSVSHAHHWTVDGVPVVVTGPSEPGLLASKAARARILQHLRLGWDNAAFEAGGHTWWWRLDPSTAGTR